ncbi:hypothetical protein ACFUJY_23205 [Streptomyces sp. NPDC057249]|uniref:hypothetical protein n=1 Tax=Streptomyces sp. NPDC057249 TaxID=3346067 RepID=UPI00362F96C9
MHDPLADIPLAIREPVRVIQDVVRAVDPHVGDAAVLEALDLMARQKAVRRRLATALESDPGLLDSGRPEGPPTVEKFIRALQARGATRVLLPRCARCQKQHRLVGTDGKLRICGSCLNKRDMQPCTSCGRTLPVANRDRHGQPRCVNCPPVDEGDPLDAIWTVLASVEHGLSRQEVDGAVRDVAKMAGHQRKLAWALENNPALLTGDGSDAVGVPPQVVRLTAALLERGARNIVKPCCPFCGKSEPLNYSHEGKRCCRYCYHVFRADTCSRCGERRRVATRFPDGGPLCNPCLQADPLNHDPCTSCGRTSLIIRSTGDQRLCRRCYRGPIAVCAFCGQTRPCSFTDTESPRCEASYTKSRTPQSCSRCHNVRQVARRMPDGQPVCGGCSQVPEPCAGCGKMTAVRGRSTTGEGFCQRCYARHPDAQRTCVQCGTLERLYHHGLCHACALRRRVEALLADETGAVRSEAVPVAECLYNNDHRRMLKWLRAPSTQNLLRALALASGPLTHSILDGLKPFGAVRHLRAALVIEGALPPRDEQIARLEVWIARHTARIEDPTERQAVRGFAAWHHLRRLRREAEKGPISPGQADLVRRDVRGAIKLLAHLREHGTSLSSSTQHDIDNWLAEGGASAHHARGFLLWAVRRKHASGVVIPAPEPTTSMELVEEDQRWSFIQRLIHDEELEVSTRVAGLLLLLFAQPLTRISRLRTDDVVRKGTTVKLRLGRVPTELPPPLDGLVLELVDKRHGYSVLGRTNDHPWLIPGSGAGQPIGAAQLGVLLKRLGIRARPARNSALMDIAAELPAAALNRLLGLHINSATRWTRDAGSPRAGYAAELARRSRADT